MLYNELQKTNYGGVVSTQTRNHTRLYNRFNNSNVDTKKPQIVNNVHQHQTVAIDSHK